MRPGDALAADRESTVVCVFCDGEPPSGLGLLADRTPPEIPLLLAGWRPEWTATFAPQREVLAIPVPAQSPSTRALADLARLTGGADLVLLHGGARVPPKWVQRLAAAALSDGGVGTASPLYGTMLADQTLGDDPAELDRRVAAAATGNRPRVRDAAPHCVHVPRRTLELIGTLPGDMPTLAAAIADISARCLQASLLNVVADDLYVGGEPRLGRARGAANQPGDEHSPLTRTLRAAQAAAGGLSVTIDARSLGPNVGGTQRYTLELALALARFTDLRLRAVVAHDIDPGDAAELQATGAVEVISYEQAVAGVARSHVVHRPQQVFSLGDLNLMDLLGQRSVVTHPDLIAYHNPSYHPSAASHDAHRRLTRQALGVADRVLFLSEHSRRDAVSEDLISPERCEVIGAAAFSVPAVGRPEPPPGAPRDRPFILCLGSDYRHKNRVFAIAVAAALRRDHGWAGQLVLAGGHVDHGSSRQEEEQLLAVSESARQAVVDVGRVSDAQRTWLLEHARAVIVPSVTEGFGLVPLEAAHAGTPCLFAPHPPLTEVIDRSLATLVAWEPTASATRVAPLLADGPSRQRHLELLHASAARWSWERLAGALTDCYVQTMRSPHRVTTAQVLRVLEHEPTYQRIEKRYRGLGDEVALIGNEGLLTAEEQQGLLRVGSRPTLARAVLWPFARLGALRSPRRRND